MRARLLYVSVCLLIAVALKAQTVPTPDHVVVLMMENHGYSEIIGANTGAPYINSLATDTEAALFTNSLAITHPSQPNYLYLFSGSSQGVLGDLPLASFQLPLTSANLAAELLAYGHTFKAFSEDLPSVGYTGNTSNNYVRRHCPWVNWQGNQTNDISPSLALPFDSFPTNFNDLPTLCWVIPNLQDDMHDGTIAQGDTWVRTHMDAYVQWAKAHNSLLILTYDEDENTIGNSTPVTTIFIGQMVKAGQYNEAVDHNRVLRTMEDMYGLTYAGASANSTPITDCWVYKPVSAWSESPLHICQNQSVTVTDTSVNTPLSWTWSFSGGSPATASGKTPAPVTYNAPGTYDVSLITYNHMGYDTVIKHNYVTVTAYPTITLSTDTLNICSGAHATITAGGAAVYNWLPGSNIISTSGNTLVAAPVVNTTYCVTGSTNGCAADTAAVTVIVDSLLTPVVNISANPSVSVCYGSTVLQTANVVNGGTPVYQWQINGVSVGGDSATFNALAVSSYSIKCVVTSSLTCASIATVSSNTLHVTVNALPVVAWNGGSQTLYTNSAAVTLSGATPVGGSFTGTGVSANTFYPDSAGPGNYTITYNYTDTNGCSGSATKTFVVLEATGIVNEAKGEALKLYPNPVAEQLNILLAKVGEVNTQPIIYNAIGQQLKLAMVKTSSGFLINTNNLAPGYYLIKLTVEGEELVRQFVKE